MIKHIHYSDKSLNVGVISHFFFQQLVLCLTQFNHLYLSKQGLFIDVLVDAFEQNYQHFVAAIVHLVPQTETHSQAHSNKVHFTIE